MTRRIHHFGACSLDVAARKLVRADEHVIVSPTVFDCIAYLLEHRDRAVGRDELVAAVWGRTGVSDSVLGKTLFKARRAVGDSGNEQNVIRTVPRFGFHWVAEVRIEDREVGGHQGPDGADAASQASAPAAEDSRSTAGTRHSRTIVAFVGIAVLVSLGAWTVLSQRSGGDEAGGMSATPASARAPARLAVLPVDVAADSADAWLRFGLMDLLAHQLHDGGVAVVPSESVVRLIGTDHAIDGDALRMATGARLLARPTLRRVDGDWLLRAEMIGADGSRREVQARGDDPIVVTRDAAAQLLAVLGKASSANLATLMDLSSTELSQRVEAAMLAGDVEAARRLLDAAPAAQQALPELRLRGAEIDYRAGRTDMAYRKLVALRDDLGLEQDPVLRARILGRLGSAARVRGDFEAAQSAFDDAIAALDGQHEPVTLGQIYVGRSINRIEQGRYSEASDDFSLARTVFQSIDDRFELTMADFCEGLMENRRNRPLSALPIFERVADRFERFGALNELVNVRSIQILTQYNLLRHGDALAASERSLPLLEQLQNPLARHQLQYARAMSLAAVGRLAEARAGYAELADSVDPTHEARIGAMIRVRQADLELQAGDAAAAEAIARRVSGMPAVADTVLIRASGWLTVVQALVARDRTTEADEQARQLTAWAEASGNSIAILYGRLATAEAARARGHTEAALPLYAEAMRRVEREGVPADVALVAVSYANALIAAGDLVRAGTVAGRITRYAEQDFVCALLLVELYHAMGQTDAWRTALEHVRGLAGERHIPSHLLVTPPSRSLDATANEQAGA